MNVLVNIFRDLFMTSAQKKSRKKLYGLLVENLEDTSEKTVKIIGSVKIFQKKVSPNTTYDKKNSSSDDHYYSNIPTVIVRHTRYDQHKHHGQKFIKSKIKHSKISISYHRKKINKNYYGSKTQNTKKRFSKQSSKYYEPHVKDYNNHYLIKKIKLKKN